MKLSVDDVKKAATYLEEVTMATLHHFETNKRDSLLMAGLMQTMESNLGSMPANMMDVKFAVHCTVPFH
jgi:hypothetical protein